MKKNHARRDLIFDEKRQEAVGKKIILNLLELIQVSVMMKIMKLVEYNNLLVNLKTDNLKKLEKDSNKKIKELEDEIKELKLQLASQITQ